MGAPPFVVDKLKAQSAKYTPAALQKGLGLLSYADRALKGATALTKVLGRALGERVILTRLVTDLVALGAP